MIKQHLRGILCLEWTCASCVKHKSIVRNQKPRNKLKYYHASHAWFHITHMPPANNLSNMLLPWEDLVLAQRYNNEPIKGHKLTWMWRPYILIILWMRNNEKTIINWYFENSSRWQWAIIPVFYLKTGVYRFAKGRNLHSTHVT